MLAVFDYLHQVHVVQGHVVELNVLYDGGGAGVVGSIDEGKNLIIKIFSHIVQLGPILYLQA